MSCFKSAIFILILALPATVYGQFNSNFWQADVSFTSSETSKAPARSDRRFDLSDLSTPAGFGTDALGLSQSTPSKSLFDSDAVIFRGQSGGSGGGGGAGAGAATDPTAPLAQLQLQNVFIPETYDSSGYANQFIIQPVIPIFLDFENFPYHIIRPTLPVISPTADPDGPLGVEGGLGDLAIVDAIVHPIKKLKTNVGGGYIVVAPTATDPQLGLQEWQLGPTIFAITKIIPKWNLGALVEVPFSLESDAYAVQMQPIAVRLLPDEWYVGWGDLNWTLDDQNGNYNLPINLRIGKVCKVGDQPLNVFVMPFYTPDGLRKGPAAEWGIKLSVTFLFSEMKLNGPLFGDRS
jgi:hypothetical protein